MAALGGAVGAALLADALQSSDKEDDEEDRPRHQPAISYHHPTAVPRRSNRKMSALAVLKNVLADIKLGEGERKSTVKVVENVS